MLAIQLVEAPRFPALLTEELDDAHSSQALLHKSIDARDSHADVAISLAHAFSEEAGHQHDEWNYSERPKRHPPIHDQHRNADRDEREQITEARDDSRCKQLVERFYIRGHPRNQSADRIAIEVCHRQSLQVAEDFHSQIAHYS